VFSSPVATQRQNDRSQPFAAPSEKNLICAQCIVMLSEGRATVGLMYAATN
jgi:hypothetical protein